MDNAKYKTGCHKKCHKLFHGHYGSQWYFIQVFYGEHNFVIILVLFRADPHGYLIHEFYILLFNNPEFTAVITSSPQIKHETKIRITLRVCPLLHVVHKISWLVGRRIEYLQLLHFLQIFLQNFLSNFVQIFL